MVTFGNPFDAMKRFCLYSQCSPKPLDIFSPKGGCSEGLDASRFFLSNNNMCDVYHNVSVLFLLFFWCPCMAINVSVQYNGGLLPDIIYC